MTPSRCSRVTLFALSGKRSRRVSTCTLNGESVRSRKERYREMVLDELSPELAPFARDLVYAADVAGLQPRVTSTNRTHSQQGRLYRGYLANPGRAYPVAPPGYSSHEYGEAFDLVVTPLEALADVGYTWQQWGGGWNPADAVHFELPGASEYAREQGRLLEVQSGDSAGARATGFITIATDFYLGSNVAGLLKLIPGLSKSEALRVLSSLYESL